ncbi:hypothetical protein HY375_02035 [Candidatus Berkelbacteria bacterium]|nr:hypothetical protein [Candidatus Berkelbacteria bacterium]
MRSSLVLFLTILLLAGCGRVQEDPEWQGEPPGVTEIIILSEDGETVYYFLLLDEGGEEILELEPDQPDLLEIPTLDA